ncbi:MAG: PBP1A family penicillin-binding protein [Gemmatimonadales bacterium]
MGRLSRVLFGWWHSPAVRFRVLLTIGAIGVFGASALVGAWFNVCGPVGSCPSIAGLESYDPDQASKVYAADGRLITDFGLQRRTVVGIKQMSPAVISAFLSTEDRRFYSHGGIDWIRFFGSVKSILTGKRVEGFSTITMQLAGNLWPDQIDRSKRSGFDGITRKLREARMAIEIERNYRKDKILELYLNQINLGNGAYGVEAASGRYFGKSARLLNVAEAATLAAIPRAPTRYNPRRNPDLAVQRRNLIINLLRDQGKLAAESAEAWKAYPLALSTRSDFTGVGDYFVEYVRQVMQARFGSDLYTGGYRIYTTLDLDMQFSAERALEAQLTQIEDGKTWGRFPHETFRQYLDGRDAADDGEGQGPFSPYLQGAIVTIEPRTGRIRAMVGGRDFADSKYNRVTQALRQAGSTFKPFVYGAALLAGYRWSDIYEDSPIEIPIDDQPPWAPKNYDLKYNGFMAMREGLFDSRNTVAVKVGLDVGIAAVVKMAAAAGIATRIPRVPSIFIGAAEVTPLEITSAYGTFANLGVRVPPQAIDRVEDASGNILWQPEARQTRVMDAEHAWLLLDGMRDVVRKGTASGLLPRAGLVGLPAAGKTGTTNDGMDVWFVGFTPDLVTGVWMGFDKKQVIMANAQGGRLAAPAWGLMMKEVYERRRIPEAWAKPADITAVVVDKTTGFLPSPQCPAADLQAEYYFPGTEPTERCPVHGGGPIPARLRPSSDTIGVHTDSLGRPQRRPGDTAFRAVRPGADTSRGRRLLPGVTDTARRRPAGDTGRRAGPPSAPRDTLRAAGPFPRR